MDPSSQTKNKVLNAVTISGAVVLNIISWMLMITAIALGAKHLDRCPIEPYIPIYLIVLGVASILSLSLTCTRSIFENMFVSFLCSGCMAIMHVFNFCWLIAGSVWIYPLYPPNYIPGALYCHKMTYDYAFGITTLLWVFAALVPLCACCSRCCLGCWTGLVEGRMMQNQNPNYGSTTAEPPVGDV